MRARGARFAPHRRRLPAATVLPLFAKPRNGQSNCSAAGHDVDRRFCPALQRAPSREPHCSTTINHLPIATQPTPQVHRRRGTRARDHSERASTPLVVNWRHVASENRATPDSHSRRTPKTLGSAHLTTIATTGIPALSVASLGLQLPIRFASVAPPQARGRLACACICARPLAAAMTAHRPSRRRRHRPPPPCDIDDTACRRAFDPVASSGHTTSPAAPVAFTITNTAPASYQWDELGVGKTATSISRKRSQRSPVSTKAEVPANRQCRPVPECRQRYRVSNQQRRRDSRRV